MDWEHTLFIHYCTANHSRIEQSLPVLWHSWISLCPGSSGSIAGVGCLNSTVSVAQQRTCKLLGRLECLEVNYPDFSSIVSGTRVRMTILTPWCPIPCAPRASPWGFQQDSKKRWLSRKWTSSIVTWMLCLTLPQQWYSTIPTQSIFAPVHPNYASHSPHEALKMSSYCKGDTRPSSHYKMKLVWGCWRVPHGIRQELMPAGAVSLVNFLLFSYRSPKPLSSWSSFSI